MDAEYAQAYGELHQRHWWWRARRRFVLSIIRDLAKGQSQTILDVGCGSGWGFADWQQFGEVEGLEIDSELVSRAGEWRSQIHLGSLDDSFQPGKQFSIILMLDVLEHMRQPVEALQRVRDLLTPGGMLLITVPALPWLWTNHDVINHHFLRYTRRTLKRTIQSAGLTCTTSRYFFHWLVPIKMAIRVKEMFSRPSGDLPFIPTSGWNDRFYKLSICEQLCVPRWLSIVGSSLLAVVKK